MRDGQSGLLALVYGEDLCISSLCGTYHSKRSGDNLVLLFYGYLPPLKIKYHLLFFPPQQLKWPTIKRRVAKMPKTSSLSNAPRIDPVITDQGPGTRTRTTSACFALAAPRKTTTTVRALYVLHCSDSTHVHALACLRTTQQTSQAPDGTFREARSCIRVPRPTISAECPLSLIQNRSLCLLLCFLSKL